MYGTRGLVHMHICPHHGCKWISRPSCIKLMNGLEFKQCKKPKVNNSNGQCNLASLLKAAFIFKNCAYTKAVRSVELFLWWNNHANNLQTRK